MIVDAAETVLALFGFDRTVYENCKKNKGRKWYEELREERARDIQTDYGMITKRKKIIWKCSIQPLRPTV